MGGRPTAEMVAKLRGIAEMLGQKDLFLSGLMCHEAADRLTELDVEVERLRAIAGNHCGCLSDGEINEAVTP